MFIVTRQSPDLFGEASLKALLSMVEELANILTLLPDEKKRRNLELAGEKGAGAWLTALPLQSMGYTLNKQEFRELNTVNIHCVTLIPEQMSIYEVKYGYFN